jgi:hypothetical protein
MIMTKSIVLFFTFLVFFVSPPTPVEAAWIIRSIEDNAWATGLGRYESLRRVLVVNTRFHDGTSDVDSTSTGSNIDTDCELLLADGTGNWLQMPFETPQMCVGGLVVYQDTPGVAVILGIDGDQASLVNIQDVDKAESVAGSSFPLSTGRIPVAVSHGDPQTSFIYVALHDMDGNAKFSGFGQTRVDTLKNMMSYWDMLTIPSILSETQTDHVPHIVKFDPSNGVKEWLSVLDTEAGTEGSSTIAAMQYSNFDLIVSGSTNAKGETFGSEADGSWDGYVVFIDPVTGSPDATFADADSDVPINRPVIRIRSTTSASNEYVHDMCMIENDLYVVGTTEGQIDGFSESGGAFVVKIDTAQRVITGRLQIPDKDRTGLKIVCSATHVYFGGHIVYPTDPEREQDVYVTAYESNLNTRQWDVVVDSTPYFEEPRRDQLVDLEVNPAGDINVLWNSQILSTGINHIIYMDLQAGDGANEIQKGVTAEGSGGIPDGGVEIEPAVEDENKAQATTEQEQDQKMGLALGLGIGIPLVLAVIVGAYAYSSSRHEVDNSPMEESEEGAPIHEVAEGGIKRDGVV